MSISNTNGNGDPVNDAPGAVHNQTGDPANGTPAGTHGGDRNNSDSNNSNSIPTSTSTSTSTPQGQSQNSSALDEVKFSQRQLNAFLASQKRQLEAEFEQKSRAAEMEAQRRAAEEQGQFKMLYEQLKAEIEGEGGYKKQIAALTARVAEYQAAEMERLSAEIEKWPASLRKLDPGADKPEERKVFFESHRDIAQELLGAATPPPPGNGPNPRPSGSSGPAALMEATRQEMQSARSRYSA